MTTDHPLGDIDPTSGDDVITTYGETKSIVDDVLNLDAFLAGDVRRAEKTARFCTKPDLEATIEDLHAELDALTDAQGRPLATDDDLAGSGRSAALVNSELIAAQQAYQDAMASVRLRAMDEDDWTAFQARHKDTLNSEPPYPAGFYDDLIVCSEALITFPGGKAEKIKAAQLPRLRKVLGHAAYNEIAQTAWAVNTSSGVSVPKSPLSLAVLRHMQRG